MKDHGVCVHPEQHVVGRATILAGYKISSKPVPLNLTQQPSPPLGGLRPVRHRLL